MLTETGAMWHLNALTLIALCVATTAIFYRLTVQLDRQRDFAQLPWFNLYRGVVFTSVLFIGVLSLVWFLPDTTATALRVTRHYTISTATMMAFEALFVGLLMFGWWQWQALRGKHRWQ